MEKFWMILALLLLFMLAVMCVIVTRLSRKRRNDRIAIRYALSWLSNFVQKKGNDRFFKANHFRRIGILGYNSFSLLLEQELQGTDIEVMFCLDSRFRGLPPIPGLTFINAEEFEARKDEVDALVDMFPEENHECQRERQAVKQCFAGEVVKLEDLIYYSSELISKQKLRFEFEELDKQ